jgi:hypothetical protein
MASVRAAARLAVLPRKLSLATSNPSRPAAAAALRLSGLCQTRLASTVHSVETKAEDEGRDIEVGELQGASFRVEPLRRTGEDMGTMRARLLCE